MDPEPSESRAGKALGSLVGYFWVALFIYLQFGGVILAFTRRGPTDGLIAVFVPPFAWYIAVVAPFEKSPSQTKADENIERLGYAIVYSWSGEVQTQSFISQEIPALQKIYSKTSHDYRSNLDKSLSALVDIQADLVEELGFYAGNETPDAFNWADFEARNKSLFDTARSVNQLSPLLAKMRTDLEAFSRLSESQIDPASFRRVRQVDPVESAALMEKVRAAAALVKQRATETKTRILWPK